MRQLQARDFPSKTARTSPDLRMLLGSVSILAVACLAAFQAGAQTQNQSAQDGNVQQQDEGGLEEIIITGTRREQSLNEVSTSVTAFTSEDIAKSNLEGVSDYFFRTPNVSFVSAGSRDQKELSIRGVTNQLDDDQMVRGQTFAFYIDEFNIATGTSNPPMLDVERIEVFRGPQGTFFGRNAVGGAINMTTKKPTNEWYLETGAEYSRFDSFDIHGVANIPVVEDTLAVRVAAKHDESDGNIKNINEIGGGNGFDYDYLRGTVRFTPTDRLTVDIQGTLSEEVVGMREGVPTGVLSTFARNIFFGGDPDAEAIPDGVGFFPENDNRVNFNRQQGVGRNFHYITSRAVYEFDTFSITNVIGFLDSKQFLEGDIDGSSLDAFFERKDQFRDAFSEEIRFQSLGSGDFEWTLGAMFTRETGELDQETFAGPDNAFGLPSGFQVTATLQDGRNKSYAAFGELGWHATPDLTMTVGGRFTHEDVRVRGFNVSSGEINTAVDDSADFSDFSPRFSVRYTPTDTTSLYATASRGFKSGGVQVSEVLDDPAFDEETIWNFEAGSKARFFDGRLSVNSAVFLMDWSDLQSDFAFGVVDENDVISFVQGIENATSATNLGAELELSALAAPGLRLDFSVGFLDSEFGTFENAFVDGQVVDLSDRQMPNAPKWTLSGAAEYSFSVSEGYDAYIRGEWFYRGDIVSSKVGLVREEFPFQVPSFNNVDLRAGDNTYFTNAFQKGFIGGVHAEPSFLRWGFGVTMKLGEQGA